jgi:alkylation response protein AidB-like acyl-CoA dehydrogenase
MSKSLMEKMLRALAQSQANSLPLPASGDTWARFTALSEWAAEDLSLGRLAEGHFDALAILAEAKMPAPPPGINYGVWAARSSSACVEARQESDGWRLSGMRQFCSGYGVIDRALVTAEAPDGYRLFDISLVDQVASVEPNSWPSVGMADSQSHTVEFGGPPLTPDNAVGGPGFYLERPGFWFGGAGVAACWYGGAVGLLQNLVEGLGATASDLVLVSVGQAVSRVVAMRHILKGVAREIDDDPFDAAGGAQRRTMVARDAVREGALAVLDLVATAGGARPLCHNRDQGQRAADLFVFLAQHHGPQDALTIGTLALKEQRWS